MRRKKWGAGSEKGDQQGTLPLVEDQQGRGSAEPACLRVALVKEVLARGQECEQALAVLERKRLVLRGLEEQLGL